MHTTSLSLWLDSTTFQCVELGLNFLWPESPNSSTCNLESLEGRRHLCFHCHNPQKLLSRSAWHLKLAWGLEKDVSNKSHEAMVVMHPSLDIDKQT